jgi:predicted dehydrogenase
MQTGDNLSVSRAGKDVVFRFYGDLGCLEFWGWEDSYRIFSREDRCGTVIQREADRESAHQRHLERLAAMIAAGTPDYEQLDLSLSALEVCQGAYLSDRTRRVVELPLDEGAHIAVLGADDWEPGTAYQGEHGHDGRAC